MSTDDLDTVAEELLRDLRNPLLPTFCIGCLDVNVERLLREEGTRQANALRLQQQHHALLTSIMSFVTAVHSEESMAALAALLFRTQSSCPRSANHDSQSFRGPDCIEILPDTALMILLHAIIVCIESSSKLLRKQLFSRRGVWPRSIEDVIPRGARESLTAFMIWLHRAFHVSWAADYAIMVETTFILVLTVCRPEWMEELATDRTRKAFVDFLINLLDSVTSILRNRSQPLHPAQLRMDAVLSIIQAISLDPGSPASAWGDIVNGSQTRLLRALQDAWDSVDVSPSAVLELPHSPVIKEKLLMVQISIHHTMGPLHKVPPHLLELYKALPGQSDGIYFQFAIRIHKLAQDVLCNAPDCRKHARQAQTGKLQVCGGCRLLKYCSRECQKRHWSVQKPPHKEICGKLKVLFTLVPFTLERDAFAAACKATPFSPRVFEALFYYLEKDVQAELEYKANTSL